jgi:hypothetical protein
LPTSLPVPRNMIDLANTVLPFPMLFRRVLLPTL